MCGSWDGWKDKLKLKKRLLQFAEAYENYVWIRLKPGEYEYKFIIGEQWVHDPTFPNKPNYFGSQNNIISVRSKYRDPSVFNF